MDRWAWLYPELRTLVRGWLLPPAVGVVSAVLVGLALAIVLGHQHPEAVSWHNFAAVLVGFVMTAYAFARAS